MDVFSVIVVYVMVWWVLFLCILPVRLKSDKGDAPDRAPDEGITAAPQNPMMKQKFIATALLSIVVTAVIYLLITADIISFRDIATAMIQEDYQ